VRTVELGRTAAQAELLRFKRMLRRQAMRGVWGAVAAVFAVAVLAMIHVLAFVILEPLITPIWSAVVVLAFDLLMLVIFGLIAVNGKPDRIEIQAREVRDLALLEMRESMAVSALLNPVGRVVLKAAGRGALGALTPGFLSRKRRR
jgi:hypothetical protein